MRLTTDLRRIGDNIFFGSDIIGTVLRTVRIAITVTIACPIIDNVLLKE